MNADREMPEPGEARDALVATLVMGQQVFRTTAGEVVRCGVWTAGSGGPPYVPGVAYYSADDHAALDSLLHMQREGFQCELHGYEDGEWFANVWKHRRAASIVSFSLAAAVTEAEIRAKWAEEDAP